MDADLLTGPPSPLIAGALAERRVRREVARGLADIELLLGAAALRDSVHARTDTGRDADTPNCPPRRRFDAAADPGLLVDDTIWLLEQVASRPPGRAPKPTGWLALRLSGRALQGMGELILGRAADRARRDAARRALTGAEMLAAVRQVTAFEHDTRRLMRERERLPG